MHLTLAWLLGSAVERIWDFRQTQCLHQLNQMGVILIAQRHSMQKGNLLHVHV